MGKTSKKSKTKPETAKTHDLMCVEDGKIRLRAFREADKMIRKLDQLEKKIQSFHNEDQKLFQEWEALTFRKEQAQARAAEAEYEQLSRFHNRMLATAHMLDIELYEAYLLLKEEEKAYEAADLDGRIEIEKKWAERDQFAMDEMKKEFSSEQAHDGIKFDDMDFDDLQAFTDEEKQMMDDIEKMSDREIEDLLQPDMGFFNLLTCFELGSASANFRPFLKLWALAPKQLRTEFSRVFKKMSGERIEDVLVEIQQAMKEDLSDKNQQSEEEYINTDYKFSPDLDSMEMEKLKTLYRKLARQLHPDLVDNPANSQTTKMDWMPRHWERLQQYYHDKNIAALERLYALTLLRLKDLTSLTLTEILESQEWLEDDLEDLKQSSEDLRKSWSWGFSKRKNFEPLIKKIKKSYQQQIDHLVEEASGLKLHHEMLEIIGQESQKKNRRRLSHRFSRQDF